MQTEAQSQAIRNLSDSVNLAAELPHRVLDAEYADVYVMDFHRLLRQDTVDIFKMLIEFEGSTAVVVANFPEIEKEHLDWRDDVFFLSASTEIDAYWSFIRRNIVEFGQKRNTPDMRAPWLIFAWRIGACSDIGSWCIYGRMQAEIALLGFKKKPSTLLEKKLSTEYKIEKLADALERDTFFGEPCNEVSKRQRSILRAAYIQ